MPGTRKMRSKSYNKLKRKRFGGPQGSKERLKLKCNNLKQSCREILEDKAVLEEQEARLRKEHAILKRLASVASKYSFYLSTLASSLS